MPWPQKMDQDIVGNSRIRDRKGAQDQTRDGFRSWEGKNGGEGDLKSIENKTFFTGKKKRPKNYVRALGVQFSIMDPGENLGRKKNKLKRGARRFEGKILRRKRSYEENKGRV